MEEDKEEMKVKEKRIKKGEGEGRRAAKVKR